MVFSFIMPAELGTQEGGKVIVFATHGLKPSGALLVLRLPLDLAALESPETS